MARKKRPPRKRKKTIHNLTPKDLAVLQAISELGESATVGEILKRANQILNEKLH